MQSFPFDSQITGVDEETGVALLDRAQSAKLLQKFLGQLYTDGIFQSFEDSMKVSPGTGMNVLVNIGGGFCGGSVFIEESIRTLALQASDMSLDRIDAVVARKDNNTAYRSTDLYVVTGTPSTTPVAPEPTRNDSVHEIVLAHVFVPAGTTAITAQRITDTRLNEDICGIATPMERVSTKGIFDQYQAALDAYLDTVAAALDGTLAGKLQNQIGVLDNLKTDIKTSMVDAVNWLLDDLYGIVGTEDISKIGDGTVKGAISALNSNIVANIGKLVTIGDWSTAWNLTDAYANIGNNLSGSLANQPYYEIGTGSDGYVKVLHPGLYFISMTGACFGVSSSASGLYYARIRKNGEMVTNQKNMMQHYHYGSGSSRLNFSTVEWLDEGDVIRMEVSANLANNFKSDGKERLTLYKLA